MVESLDAIMALLACEEPVTMKTDWFELNEARLHLAPYTNPHFEVAVASTVTPFGMMAAGKHGVSVLSIGAGLPGGPEGMSKQWQIAEEEAAKHGKTMQRQQWRIVVNMHCAEDDELALREVSAGEREETLNYFENTLGRPPGRSDDPLREGVKMGTTLVGSPDTIAAGIQHLLSISGGGFGGVLFRANEWANREQIMRSYELFARYVMPRFQGSLNPLVESNTWVKANRATVLKGNVEAVEKAFTDLGRSVPAEARARTLGVQDREMEVDEPKSDE
jgi:limonene 1,2-monooxygenase